MAHSCTRHMGEVLHSQLVRVYLSTSCYVLLLRQYGLLEAYNYEYHCLLRSDAV